MSERSEVIGATSLVITQGVVAFTTFLPRLSEIRKAQPHVDTNTAGDVRMGEFASMVLLFGVAGVSSYITGDLAPVYTAAILGIVLISLYEWTLAKQRFCY